MVACVVSRLMECAPGGIPYGVKLAAEQGDADAQYQMGQAYDHGRVVHIDNMEAAKWYQMAAEQGHVDAQYKMGDMHRSGVLTWDGREALRWYQTAAEQGNAKAQYSMGMLYHDGFGIGADCDEARKWFMTATENLRAAAERGDADAQYLLGNAYEHSRGVPEDHEKAIKWYQEAAKQGLRGAWFKLYHKLEWFRKAAE